MTQRIYKSTILLLSFLLLAAGQITAQVIPETDFPKLDGRFLVVDSAGVFSETGKRALEAKLVAYDKTQSTQIAVVTIKDLGPYEVSQYATEMAHHLGIGRKGKDNGILILFALRSRKVHIATGYGTEGRITDGIAGTIIRNDMIPYFKQEKYEAGLTKGAESVMRYLDGEYKNDSKDSGGSAPIFSLIVIIFIVFIIMMVMGKGGKGGRGGGQYMSRRGSDFITGMILGELLGGGRRGGGGFGGGSGGFGGGSSGGGSFGGFGGGGFGGGGASGSW